MPLTPEEEKELAQLEAAYGAPKTAQLTPQEEEELNTLQTTLAPEELKVVNERTPYVDIKDRLLYKNFGSESGAGFNWLQKKYPDLNFRKDDKGDVLVKKPTDPEWKKLDPSATWYNPLTYELADIGDVAYDTGAGIASGAAATAAGLGGLVTGPGALLAAGAAGGATSAGLEAGRQKIGQSLGMGDENLDWTQIGIAGGTGAVAPVLLGVGGSAAQIAKSGLAKKVGEEAARESTKGLIARGAARIGGGLSGTGKEAVEAYAKNAPKVDKLIDEGAADYITGVQKKIVDTVETERKSIGAQMGQKIKEAEGAISPDDVFKPLEEKLASLKAKRTAGTPKIKVQIDALETQLKEAKQGLPPDLTPDELFDLQKTYKPLAKFGEDTAGLTPAEMAEVNAYRDVYGTINKKLEETANVSGLKKEYKKLIELDGQVDKYFATPEKTYRSLSGMEAPSKEFVRKTAGDLKEISKGQIDIKDDAAIIKAYSLFKDPSIMPISGQGATGTSRTLSTQALGEAAGNAVVPGSGGVVKAVTSALGGPAAVKTAAKGVYKYNQLAQQLGQIVPQPIQRFTPSAQTQAQVYSNMLRTEK